MPDATHREVIVFNTALDLPPMQRELYLQEACAGDAALHRRIAGLLRAHERAGEFLRVPASASAGLVPPPPPSVYALPMPGAAGAGGEQPGDRVGCYRLLRQIGEGGCGVVYLAEQEEPFRRQVALKIIKLGMDTRRVIARFEAERQALAMMDHPNIARVLDAGATATGRPFFVMEVVRGTKITEYCDQNALTVERRLELFVQVCRAIQHAHQKSVIHRDIKPSNILVTVNDGLPVPKVIDFGIAKATDARLGGETLFTPLGQFIGTPAYMSPEQGVLGGFDVDTRSDIYSLGVLLYELLTGRPPFEAEELLGGGLESIRRTLDEVEPARPSICLSSMGADRKARVARLRGLDSDRLRVLIAGDLDLITMKCLEKDRARRYESTGDLAAEVERFLAHEPILARPPSNFYRLGKLVRRHRLAVGAAAAVISALLLGLGLSTWQYLEKSNAELEQKRLRQEAQRAQADEAASRRKAEAQELRARRMAYGSDMNLLPQALAADDLGRAQELLNRQRPQLGEEDLRGWEWRYYWQFCRSDAAFTLSQRSNSILSVSFSHDGALLAACTYLQDEVTVWEVSTRQLVFRHSGAGINSSRLAFAPDRSLLAYYDGTNGQGNVVLWDSTLRQEIRRLPVEGSLRELSFIRDGRLFTLETGRSNNLALWDTSTGRELSRSTARVPGHAMGRILDARPDGSRWVHATQGAPHSVRVCDAGGGVSGPLRVANEIATAVTFSPDGKALVTGGGYAEGSVKLWDVSTQRMLGSLEGHRSWVSCLRFLPDGRTLASSSADRTVRLWDIETRSLIRTLRGESSEIWTFDISHDGRWLAGGGKDGSITLWDLNSAGGRPPGHRTLPLEGAGPWCPSPDGRLLGVIHRRRLSLYDSRSLQLLEELPPPMTNLVGAAFSPDMRLIVATDHQGQLLGWDIRAGRLVTNLVAHGGPASLGPVFLNHGRSVITYGQGMFKQWDVSRWTEETRWSVASRLSTWMVRPEAGKVVAGWNDGALECIPVDHPELRRRFLGRSRVRGVDLSPDGLTLAAASENGTLELWDTESSRCRAVLKGVLLGYHSVAFSPEGERIIGGSNGQEAVKMWDARSGVEVATLGGDGSFFVDSAFFPDGNTVGAANWSGTIHLWSAPSWEEIRSAEASRTLAAAMYERIQH